MGVEPDPIPIPIPIRIPIPNPIPTRVTAEWTERLNIAAAISPVRATPGQG